MDVGGRFYVMVTPRYREFGARLTRFLSDRVGPDERLYGWWATLMIGVDDRQLRRWKGGHNLPSREFWVEFKRRVRKSASLDKQDLDNELRELDALLAQLRASKQSLQITTAAGTHGHDAFQRLESVVREESEVSRRALAGEVGRLRNDLVTQTQNKHALGRESIVGLRLAGAGDKFRDRIEQIAHLRRLLVDHTVKVVCIVGRGGIGKTALLSKLCAEVERGELRISTAQTVMGADGILYVNCRDTNRLSVATMFQDVSRMLGGPAGDELTDAMRDSSRSLSDKIRVFLGTLRDRCYLIVLDNVEDMLATDNTVADPDLKLFLDLILQSQHGLRIVATSRDRLLFGGSHLRFARFVPLEHGLPVQDAVDLLRDLDWDGQLGLREAPEDTLVEASRRCFGIPKALECLAGLLAIDSRLSLADVLTDRELFNGHVVDNLAAEHYSRLSDEQQRVLEALAVYDQPVQSAAVKYLLQPIFPDVDVERTLGTLVRNYLVTFERERQTYALHPIDQRHAYQQIAEASDEGTVETYHRHAAAFFIDLANGFRAAQPRPDAAMWDAAFQIQFVDLVRPAVAHLFAAQSGGDFANVHELVKQYYLVISNWGFVQECRDVCDRALHLLDEHVDPGCRADWLHDWAVLNQRLGNWREAEQACVEGLAAAKQNGQSNLEAALLHRYGVLAQDQGRFQLCRELFERSIGITEARGGFAAAAPTWSRLAELMEGEGAIAEALDIQTRALAEAGNDMTGRLAFSWRQARLLRLQGDTRRATAIVNDCIESARQLNNQVYLGRHLHELGMISLHSREYEAAEQHLRESLAIAKRLAYPREVAESIFSLAVLKHWQGDVSAAGQMYEDSLSLDHFSINYSAAVGLGLVRLEERQTIAATEWLGRGIIWCDDLLKASPKACAVIYRRALALLSTGEAAMALEAYDTALGVCSSIGIVQMALEDIALLERAVAGSSDVFKVKERLRAVSGASTDL
jgi:tetratricopeptide (TPR) repeat protein